MIKDRLYQKINEAIDVEVYPDEGEVWLVQSPSKGDIIIIDAGSLGELIELLNKAKKELE